MTSPSGAAALSATEELPAEVPLRDSLDWLACKSWSRGTLGTGGSSSFFLFLFFFRLRRASSSFENTLGPALLGSATSPPCVFGLSVLESTDDRPLLSIALDSAEIVQERCDLLSPFRLEEEDSAILEGVRRMWR